MKKTAFALGAAITVLAATGAQAEGINPGTVAPKRLTSASYTQDFDSLGATGSALTAMPEGWQFYEGGQYGDSVYVGGVSNSSGGIHAYGNFARTERALGGIPGSTITPLYFGAIFENGLGGVIESLAITYMGEQWYNTPVAGKLEFEYLVGATDIATGNWVAFDPLDFLGPDTSIPTNSARAVATDGNAAAYRTELSGVIDGLSIGAGSRFGVRWAIADSSPALTEDGLAVDDFRLTASLAQTPAVPEPATWVMMIGGFGLIGGSLRRRRADVAFA